jgi:putative addiction module component (TIGR02574 family)
MSAVFLRDQAVTLQQLTDAALALPVSERLQLIDFLWDTLGDEAAEARPFTMTPALEAELSRRVDALDANPNAGRPWAKIRDELLGRSPCST